MRWFCTLKRNAFSHGGDGYLKAHKLPDCLFFLWKEMISAGNKSSLAEGYLIHLFLSIRGLVYISWR